MNITQKIKDNKTIFLLTTIIVLALLVILMLVVNDRRQPGVVADDQDGNNDVGYIDDNESEVLFNLTPGVNLAGAEFGIDDPDYEYNYPTSSLDYYAQKGVKLVRLPFKWERIQPNLGEPLDATEIEQLGIFLDKADELGIKVILDLHNYNRYQGNLVGASAVTSQDLSDVWGRIVTEFSEHDAVIAYGIMNEPYDTNGTWASTAQDVVNEIRAIDTEKIIIVAGDNWSKSATWQEYNSNLDINDPSNLIVYEAHVYFDTDHSGKYLCSFDECNISLDVGQESMKSFVDWLNETDNVGFVGEYGVPSNDDRWLRSIDQFLKYLDEQNIASTIWAGGPDWGDYILSIEPTENEDGQLIDSAQMDVLEKYID